MINCVITGATSGIGFEILKKLKTKKINLIIIGRNKQKWIQIKKKYSQFQKIKFFLVDLSEPQVKKKINNYFKSIRKVDILINNAGTFHDKLILNSIKIEKTFYTNLISPFILINVLKSKLLKSNLPLVLNVSSFVARFGYVNFRDLESKKNYNGWKAYVNSKLMMNLLTNYYAKKYLNKIIFLTWSPGYTKSYLGKNNNGFLRRIANFLRTVFGKDPSQAANDLIYVFKKFNNYEDSGKFIYKRKKSLKIFHKRYSKLEYKIYKYVQKLVN